MSVLRFILLCCSPWMVGCASTKSVSQLPINSSSRPKFLAELEAIDAIQVEELTIDRRKDVSRFIDVCRKAHWAPYVATMPAEIETVRFMSDGVEEHRLLYAGGWLFDTTGDGAPRFGTINTFDGAWVDEHIDTKLMLLRNAL